jgi:hypothetical protein
MSFPAFASVLLAAVLSQAPAPAPAASPDLHYLRWVRATVIALGPEAITLKLRDREITLQRDAATEIVAADPAAVVAIGATVEAHYTDRKNVRRAILLIADPGPGELSKRWGTSVRGTRPRVKWGSLSVAGGGKTRGSLAFEKQSRLVDRDGNVLATGKDAIMMRLAPDADIVVKFNNEGGVVAGDVDLGGSDNIKEIRLLR